MKILHVVPGLSEGGNGIAVAAKLIAREQSKSKHEVEVVDTRDFVHSNIRTFEHYSEIWVHSMWLPRTMRACWKVLRNVRMFECSNARPKLVRMTHANLDPLRYRYHGWKKRLVAPIERWLFKRTDSVVVTCAAEKDWCQQWGLENEFEILDLKKYFQLDNVRMFECSNAGNRGLHLSYRERAERKIKPPRLVALAEAVQAVVHHQTTPGSCPQDRSIIPNPQMPRKGLHLLYLGRRHPLKGVEFLDRAVEDLNQSFEHSEHSNIRTLDLRIVSNHFGDELENDWSWCDVLVLPTLSENFGLVVAEALERGKQVITTDGAPAWEPEEVAGGRWLVVGSSKMGIAYHGRLVYLKGFRDGTDEKRVRLLKEAIATLGRGPTNATVE